MIKELTESQIDKINRECTKQDLENQGIWIAPTGVDKKEGYVVYSKYEIGGMSGGSCYGGTPQPYTNKIPNNKFVVLDIVLEELKPDISYLEYKRIASLVIETENNSYEYYGNCANYAIEYIRLSDIYKILK